MPHQLRGIFQVTQLTKFAGGGGITNATAFAGGGGITNATRFPGGGGITNATQSLGGGGITNATFVVLFSLAEKDPTETMVKAKARNDFFI